ncbi:hypothetical protein NDU88_003590 [Pleurodeles waltl]|uniref:Uncharacterized protein n=1 Tax=Pleurodeles waltl TaxID=8319 RepID=A0AAV7TR17_PLEWA|nr:hypothetical protein NDU88_003590 [Pleurodeles waltl]
MRTLSAVALARVEGDTVSHRSRGCSHLWKKYCPGKAPACFPDLQRGGPKHSAIGTAEKLLNRRQHKGDAGEDVTAFFP